jgi:hypothetical protein
MFAEPKSRLILRIVGPWRLRSAPFGMCVGPF